ncbi:hypothetical protein IQ07DRAFT_582012 [Pyrenochaeta sp. DS3sAY3a]|nr:hypothetical protein IQ07DRAFT_582012 [Pyrenochaeta sp. DS3sAY3a]
MGWLWNSGDSAASQQQLDPSLREFLKKEAPTGPTPTLPTSPRDTQPEPKTTPQAQSQSTSQSQTESKSDAPVVPPQSQFQDGRYAHLWKNYTPQDVLVDRGKSEQDRLRDLVDAYNDRRASVGRIAMENCALEYLEQFQCFRYPSTWMSAGTMCRAESRRFNRCYDMQSKFLKALGYMTMDQRTAEEDEKIQMHADKLYQQMLQQEAEMEKAKEEGKPIPKFESILSKQNVVNAMSGGSKTASADVTDDSDLWTRIKPESRREYEKKLATLPPEEQEVERMAVLGELRASTGMAKQVEQTFIEERIKRMQRREAGQATFGDTIKRLWGWG